MKTMLFAAALIGGLGAAGSAIAGVGQCFDRFGNPVGPSYDTDRPNYGYINSVLARGGSCTGVNPGWGYGPHTRYYGYGYDNGQAYRYRHRDGNAYYSRYRSHRPYDTEPPNTNIVPHFADR